MENKKLNVFLKTNTTCWKKRGLRNLVETMSLFHIIYLHVGIFSSNIKDFFIRTLNTLVFYFVIAEERKSIK